MDEIIKPAEVADILRVCVRTVYKLAQKGVIPGRRIGRSWRFSKGDILSLVFNRERNKGSGGDKEPGHNK